MTGRISKVLVLGGGSAGFMAALALKRQLPELTVVVVRSKDIGIIGVGEGSTVPLVKFLHNTLRVPVKSFFELARPTWKLGLNFIWGPRPYFHYTFGQQVTQRVPDLPRPVGHYCRSGGSEMENWEPYTALMRMDKIFARGADGKPQMHFELSYHFENEHFVRFLETFAQSLGIEIQEDTVEHVTQDEQGVTGLVMKSGRTLTADLYVDSSGFASRLLGQALGEPFESFKSSLFCDRAVVGGWARTDEPIKPYTTCETMDSGWAWQIEHEHRINRGYVFSSAYISDSDAEAEFRRKNPKVGPTRIVRFTSGRYTRGWVKNVVGIGNATGFVEPLEATALGVIAGQAAQLAGTLADADCQIRPTQVRVYNQVHAAEWDSIRGFIAAHYKFNTRLETEFWRACRADTDLAAGAPMVAYYQENGPVTFWDVILSGNARGYRMPDFATLLVGQGVPWRRQPQPTAGEWQRWEAYRQAHRQRAEGALTVREMLAMIQSPQWDWGAVGVG